MEIRAARPPLREHRRHLHIHERAKPAARASAARLSQDLSPVGYLREYLAFAPAELGSVMPTRLGNALRATESYQGGD